MVVVLLFPISSNTLWASSVNWVSSPRSLEGDRIPHARRNQTAMILLKRDLWATKHQGLCFITNAEKELSATKQFTQHGLEVALIRTEFTFPCSIDTSKNCEQPIMSCIAGSIRSSYFNQDAHNWWRSGWFHRAPRPRIFREVKKIQHSSVASSSHKNTVIRACGLEKAKKKKSHVRIIVLL
jgi:hypothetical protein